VKVVVDIHPHKYAFAVEISLEEVEGQQFYLVVEGQRDVKVEEVEEVDGLSIKQLIYNKMLVIKIYFVLTSNWRRRRSLTS
jgi:hypothetical protein